MKLKSRGMTITLVCLLAISLVLAAGCGQQKPAAPAAAPAADKDPIKGQVVDIVVGFTPGGSFDTIARIMAPFMTKYLSDITGAKQTVIVSNVSGASGGLANAQVYKEKADRASILVGSASAITQQVGRGKVEWDVTKYTHLGSLDRPARAMVLSAKVTNIKSFKDLLDKKTPLLFGTSGFGSNEFINGQVVLNVLQKDGVGKNLQFDFVNYTGSAEVDAAILGGEVQCTMASTITAQSHAKGGAKILFQTGTAKTIEGVELLRDLVPKEAADTIDMMLSSKYFVVGSPNMKPELAAVFSKALEMTAKDPEFIANCKKAAININYLNAKDDLADTLKTYETLMKYQDLFKSFYK